MSSKYIPPQTKKVRRIELVEMLNEVARAADDTIEPLEILKVSLEIVIRRLELEAGAIYLFDEDSARIKLSVRHGISEEHAREIERRRRKQGGDIQSMVAESGEVFYVEDMSQDLRFTNMWEDLVHRSYIQIPLKSKTQVRGVMGLVSKAREPIAAEEIRILGAVGHQIGLILKNAELLAEAVRCETEAKSLLELGTQINASLELDEVLGTIAESAGELLGMEHAVVALMEESGREITIRAVSGPLEGKLRGMRISQREGAYESDQVPSMSILYEPGAPKSMGVWDLDEILSLGIVAMFAVPLLRGDRVLGLLAVMGDKPHSFSKRDMRLLQQLAHSVVVAIENATLYKQVRSMTAIEERKWLARELHDDLAQGLGLINIQTTVTEDLLSSGKIEQASESLKQVKEIANRSYTHVREAIFSLRTIVSPDTRFLATLQEYLSDYQRHYGVETSLVAEDESAVQFSDEVGAQVAYIIKESVTNARKHGDAKRVAVSITRDDCGSRITVTDNGSGFDPLTVSGEDVQQLGLQIMRERARSVKGELEVHSKEGQGTSVTLCVPIDQTK
jgi:signal transduction histidine kinase